MKRAALALAFSVSLAFAAEAGAKTAKELFAERAAELRGEPAVAAREELPAVESVPSPASDSLWRLGAVAAALAALGTAGIVIVRRRLGPGERSATRIRIAASRALGPRHHVALIEVAGRRLLVGTAPNAIVALADLSEGEDFATALADELPELGKPVSNSPGNVHVQ